MTTYFSITILPHLTVIVLAFFLMVYLAPIARQINLVDYPSSRKLHKEPIPLIGGISILLAVMLGLMLVPFGLGEYRYLFFCFGILAVVGVLDDHRDIPPAAKIITQFVVAVLVTVIDGVAVTDVGDIFGWRDGNELGLDFLSIPLTIVAIVGVINALNMIDGHDGVAGSVFVISVGSLLILCGFSGVWKYQYVLSLFGVAVLSFLVFNTPLKLTEKRRVFLGDSGSMLLGMLLAYTLIDITEQETLVLKTASAPWIIGLPLLDMMGVILLRLFARSSPFVADRRHIHHFLTDIGMGKVQVLVTLITLQLIFSGIGVLSTLYGWQDLYLFWLMFLAVAVYLGIRQVTLRRLQRIN